MLTALNFKFIRFYFDNFALPIAKALLRWHAKIIEFQRHAKLLVMSESIPIYSFSLSYRGKPQLKNSSGLNI